MMESPRFKNFLSWYDDASTILRNSDPFIRMWLLKRLPYEIIISSKVSIDQRDIGEITTGLWSAYRESLPSPANCRYFFENEIDAVAFKLKFL